jgi:predicted enzyme related to lactoylglutathione lyase
MEDACPRTTSSTLKWTTRDPRRLRSFFERLFDWEFREAMPGYTMIEAWAASSSPPTLRCRSG